MPGNKPHHTDKMRRCVDEVMGKGHDEGSAYAICTTSLQNSGESIFAAAAAGSDEELRLLGDTPGHEFHGNQWTAGSAGGTTGQKLEKAGYTKIYGEGEVASHDKGTVNLSVPAGHTMYAKEFSSEEKAFAAQDKFQYHEHPGAVASSVTSPQKSNNFYPSHVHAVTVKNPTTSTGPTIKHTGPGYKKGAEELRKTDQKLRSEFEGKRREDLHPAYGAAITRLVNEGKIKFDKDGRMKSAEAFSGEFQSLHLLGATGPIRYETLNGRKHLVVPVIALMEGVIHPVNAETPEFVSEATLSKAAASWVGRPATLGHPVKGGKQCSASDPEIRKAAGLGVIMKSEMKGKKLCQEVWIDEERGKSLHPMMYENLAAGDPIEVSVGAYVITSQGVGDFNGKRYKATWLETQGDHLAFLPGGRGACSLAMGCGTNRAAMHFVAAESIELLPDPGDVLTFSTLEDQSLDQRIAAVQEAVNAKWNSKQAVEAPPSPSKYAYATQVFDDRVIVNWGGDTFSVDYDVEDGKVVLGDVTKVKQAWVAAATKYQDCEMCGGTGQIKDGKSQKDCPTCDGEGKMKMKAAAGARHSSSDAKMIQAVHDHAASLGATCDRKNLETASAPIRPIKNEGGRWSVYSMDGLRKLADHGTLQEAKEHGQAIDAALTRRMA